MSSNLNYLAVGAYGNQSNTGAVYLFYRNTVTNNIEENLKKTAMDGAINNYYGMSVALVGDNLLVGAYANSNKGAAYIYEHNTSLATWSTGYKFFASEGSANDQYGISVTMTGHQIFIGTQYDDDNALVNSGSIYVYSKEDAKMIQTNVIYPSDATAGDLFGRFCS